MRRIFLCWFFFRRKSWYRTSTWFYLLREWCCAMNFYCMFQKILFNLNINFALFWDFNWDNYLFEFSADCKASWGPGRWVIWKQLFDIFHLRKFACSRANTSGVIFLTTFFVQIIDAHNVKKFFKLFNLEQSRSGSISNKTKFPCCESKYLSNCLSSSKHAQ